MPAEPSPAGSAPAPADDSSPENSLSETVIRPIAATKKRAPGSQPATDVPASPAAGTPAADPASAPPAAFGRYEVRRTLGSGAFGTVYLGHDAQLDRPVAIKVLRGD